MPKAIGVVEPRFMSAADHRQALVAIDNSSLPVSE